LSEGAGIAAEKVGGGSPCLWWCLRLGIGEGNLRQDWGNTWDCDGGAGREEGKSAAPTTAVYHFVS